MLVRLKSVFAHPKHGAHPAGTVIELPKPMADELIKLRYAESLDPKETAAIRAETAVIRRTEKETRKAE